MLELVTFILVVTIKALLIGTDPSTDFEVHRNWKALTNSLPISKWYYDETSYWTLDYPPIFAYMEYILGRISMFIDVKITNLNNLEYKAFTCIVFQRITVLVGDLFLFFALKKLGNALKLSKVNRIFMILLIQGFAGLIIIDNMHFQYNTLLYSIFVYSIAFVFEDNFILGAITFTILLNMKHIFLYVAPAYFVYFLKFYVLQNNSFHFLRLVKLAIVIISIFLISFSPFIKIALQDKSPEIFLQILKRLFPFKRGLIHSYWSPNFWAIYTFIDKFLFFILTKFNLENLYSKTLQKYFNLKSYSDLVSSNLNQASIGKTQEIKFNILPDIEPKHVNILIITLSIVLISSMFVFKVVKNINDKTEKRLAFTKYLILSSFIFYNFGFHVHEKAFIIISILLLVYNFILCSEETAADDKKESSVTCKVNETCFSFILRSALYIGTLSQMPLIQSKKDYFPKLFLVISYIFLVEIYFAFRNFQSEAEEKIKGNKSAKGLKWVVSAMFLTYVIIVLTCDFIFVFFNKNSFERDYNFTIPMYMQYNQTEIAHQRYLSRIENENVLENISINFPLLKGIFNTLDRFEFLPLMIISVTNAILVQIINLLSLKYI